MRVVGFIHTLYEMDQYLLIIGHMGKSEGFSDNPNPSFSQFNKQQYLHLLIFANITQLLTKNIIQVEKSLIFFEHIKV